MARHLGLPSQSHNLKTLRNSPLSEISGALGDLGTLLPFLIALSLTGSIVLSTTLVFTGLANILNGLFFSIPLPVQPMKAIAAVAIANSFSVQETTSAGLFVAGAVLIASLTGALGWVGKIVPIPVVKGIQVGAGLSLAMSGGVMIESTQHWLGDSKALAVAAFLILLLTTSPALTRSQTARFPYALVAFILGLVFALFASHNRPGFFDIWRPEPHIPTSREFKKGVLTAGIGQLPLTMLNSIIAVTHLSKEILPSPQYPEAPSFTALGISIGLVNLVSLWFGSMPICHGSGGLAGQYKFGARSGASIILLGLFKLILGLIVNEAWLLQVLDKFPKSLLGILVIASGLELARVGATLNPDGLTETEKTQRWSVMMVTVAFLLAFKNDAVGFVAGVLCHLSFTIPSSVSEWRSRNDERTSLLSGEGRG